MNERSFKKHNKFLVDNFSLQHTVRFEKESACAKEVGRYGSLSNTKSEE